MRSSKRRKNQGKAVVAELEAWAPNFLEKRQEFREARYSMLAVVARNRLRVDRDPGIYQEVVKEIMLRREESEIRAVREEKLNMTLELVALATGAATSKARKIASKSARIVDHLLAEEIRPERIRKAIKKAGGIEKLYRMLTQASGGLSKCAAGVSSDEPLFKGRTSRRRNDGEAQLTVRILASERDELLEGMTVGSVVTLLGTCVKSQPDGIKITKVSLQKAKRDETDDDEDWAA